MLCRRSMELLHECLIKLYSPLLQQQHSICTQTTAYLRNVQNFFAHSYLILFIMLHVHFTT